MRRSAILDRRGDMNEWWTAKIESIKRERGCSDVGLAKRLDISPVMLAHVRTGRRALPLQARLRLLHALGYVVTRDLLLRALPSDVRSAVIDTKAGLMGGADTEGGLDVNAGLELPPHWKDAKSVAMHWIRGESRPE